MIPALNSAFPMGRYYLDPMSAREAIVRMDVFNLVDNDSGDNVDFWLLTEEPFDQSRFGIRCKGPISGVPMFMFRPEDTILQKLKRAEMSGGSEKQFGDAVSVYELQFGLLDLGYMSAWAEVLGIREWWTRLQAESRPLP